MIRRQLCCDITMQVALVFYSRVIERTTTTDLLQCQAALLLLQVQAAGVKTSGAVSLGQPHCQDGTQHLLRHLKVLDQNLRDTMGH